MSVPMNGVRVCDLLMCVQRAAIMYETEAAGSVQAGQQHGAV